MAESTFEVWDNDTANVVSDHPTKAAALSYVRSVVREHGRSAVETWELVYVPEHGDAETVAIGEALADLAGGPVPAP